MNRRFKRIFKKHIIGLVLLSMSIGMFIMIFMPVGAYILASAMAIGGAYLLFVC